VSLTSFQIHREKLFLPILIHPPPPNKHHQIAIVPSLDDPVDAGAEFLLAYQRELLSAAVNYAQKSSFSFLHRASL